LPPLVSKGKALGSFAHFLSCCTHYLHDFNKKLSLINQIALSRRRSERKGVLHRLKHSFSFIGILHETFSVTKPGLEAFSYLVTLNRDNILTWLLKPEKKSFLTRFFSWLERHIVSKKLGPYAYWL